MREITPRELRHKCFNCCFHIYFWWQLLLFIKPLSSYVVNPRWIKFASENMELIKCSHWTRPKFRLTDYSAILGTIANVRNSRVCFIIADSIKRDNLCKWNRGMFTLVIFIRLFLPNSPSNMNAISNADALLHSVPPVTSEIMTLYPSGLFHSWWICPLTFCSTLWLRMLSSFFQSCL